MFKYRNTNKNIRRRRGAVSGAVATATTFSGVITAISVSNSGIGFTGPPNVIITSSVLNTSGLAGGTGYVEINIQVTVFGGGGSGATITPTVTSGVITTLIVSSFLTSITIVNAGTGLQQPLH